MCVYVYFMCAFGCHGMCQRVLGTRRCRQYLDNRVLQLLVGSINYPIGCVREPIQEG